MPLLNHTTDIDADKTAGEITKILACAGADRIMTQYEGGVMSSLSFSLPVGGRSVSFRLPCDWRPVFAILAKARKQYPPGDSRREHQASQIRMQSVRTTWRIILVWIRAQVALIETGIVRPEQVFLPYLAVSETKTLYDQVAEGSFMLESKGK